MNYSATYSPDDNKLRLYAGGRLPTDVYANVKAAGFRWAPKQDLFVAPMWTPAREDLLIELCGEIGDEDTSLADRAEQRAERFEEYSDKRQADAESARRGVAAIADGIPFGQPILVGHHSERHARKDAERIENGMRRAVKMWKTSQYWTDRAAGAIQHAKYKERPDVRARRIKGIEADLRKQERYKADAEKWLKAWSKDGLTLEQARAISNFCRLYACRNESAPGSWWSAYDVLQPDGERYKACPSMTVEQVAEVAKRSYPATIAHCERWIEHYNNRLAYERAMLADAGGLASDRAAFAVGGRVLRRGQWFVILKVNRESVTVAGHWATTVGNDEISDYRPPTEEEAAKVKKLAKLPPLCNYPGDGFKRMTRAELDERKERKWSDFPKIGHIKATATHGAHRVQQCRGEGQWSVVQVYVTDEKRKDPPELVPDGAQLSLTPERVPHVARTQAPSKPEGAAAFEAMAETLRAGGVQVVTAPQLFPTPPDVAARMVELAGIEAGHRILEPSAGTGALIGAVHSVTQAAEIVAIEINSELAQMLAARRVGWPVGSVQCADFLKMNGELGQFDRVLMNPPFENAADIKHIEHALHMLKPGGRLVAICANGPRQQAKLRPMATEWYDLPAGTFKQQGTGVNTALLVIEKEECR